MVLPAPVKWSGATCSPALGSIGYEGQLVIESFTPAIEEIAKAVSLWRPLAPSEDELAGEGVAFLRRMDAVSDAAGGRGA